MSALDEVIKTSRYAVTASEARSELAQLRADLQAARWTTNSALEFLQLVANERKSEYSENISAWLAANPAPEAEPVP